MDIGADCATEFPSKGVAWNQKRNFLNASGGMEHCGEKVCCEFDGPSTPVSMKFQVSDARNPLASVARITEHGNIVQFGPKDEDNCIFNPRTEEKAMTRRVGSLSFMRASSRGALLSEGRLERAKVGTTREHSATVRERRYVESCQTRLEEQWHRQTVGCGGAGR